MVEHKSNRNNNRAPKAFHRLSGPCCSFTTRPRGTHHATGESSAPIDLPCADQPIRFTSYMPDIAHASSNMCSFLVTDTTSTMAQIDKDGSVNIGVDRCATRTVVGVMVAAFLLASLVDPHSRTNTYGMVGMPDNRGRHHLSLNAVGSTNFHRGVASSRTRSYRSGSSLR